MRESLRHPPELRKLYIVIMLMCLTWLPISQQVAAQTPASQPQGTELVETPTEPVLEPPAVPDPAPSVEPVSPTESTVVVEPVDTETPVETLPVETPTETVAATEVPLTPTEIPATEVVTEEAVIATETPVTPVEIATEEATVAPVPATPEPTLDPTPTPEPPTTIHWSQQQSVQCDVHAGDATSLELTETATWRCLSSISADVQGDVPEDTHILWTIGANYGGDDVRVTLPTDSTATVFTPDPAPGGTAELITFESTWTDGFALIFDVQVTRTSCVVGEAQLVLNADASIVTSETSVQIVQAGETPPDSILFSTSAANGGPTIRFDGPISFESRSATTAGLDSSTSHGTAIIVVEGEWNPCSTWTVNLSGDVGVPTDAPAKLRVVSINNESISGETCDLAGDCALIVLPETGSAASPLVLTVGLELTLDELTPAGEFGVNLRSWISGVESQP